MDDEKLIEAVARAICCPNGCESEYPEGCDCCAFDDASRAAIAVIQSAVIDECVRVIAHEMPGPFAVIGNELIAAIRAIAAPRVKQEGKP